MSEVKTNKITSLASNNDITLDPDGTGDVVVAAGHSVGIGTAAPDEYVHIKGASGAATDVQIQGGDDTNSVRLFMGGSSNRLNGRIVYDVANNAMALSTNGDERLRVDSSGFVGIGESTPRKMVHITKNDSDGIIILDADGATTDHQIVFAKDYGTGGTSGGNYWGIGVDGSENKLVFAYDPNAQASLSADAKLAIDSSGSILLGQDLNTSLTNDGSAFVVSGGHHYLKISNDTSASSNSTMYMNRIQSDGDLISFRHENTTEGKISVGGTTVTYAGGHLARWSRLSDNSKPTTLLKGTVMTNLDEMLVWTGEDNEQHNHTAISSVEGDANVAGLFVSWDVEDGYNDFYLAMTGDMVIRIAQGTTVARGDLLMSAGDGTAKPQDDDIVRSKTIAKVTSTTKSHTYDDGSYLVPCVLMAC